ncbi:MAG: type I-U CRISPR-associated protein Cas7 [Deltaproteobacteria bacterium]|nr:type I-U CRISPR-associated protein Cas7 [Deltaproteobacteria bacterium]
MMELLPDVPRILIEADLQVLQGTRFQPTGFPDIGAASYKLADEAQTAMLLLESEQSVANRLEAVCWDAAKDGLAAPLTGMPYVRVDDSEGAMMTASLLEAHRLNSVYVEHSAFYSDQLVPAIAYDKKKPTDLKRLARALCKYDPNSLIHGTFLESIAGTLRLPRALSGFIEARDVRPAQSGGVKNDRVTPETKDSDRSAKEGYGNVPFHRDEFTAGSITAYFKLDLALIRSLGLGDAVNRFLVALALWKVRAFLDDGLRLRTSCDLDVNGITVKRPAAGWELPSRTALEDALPRLIATIQAESPETFGPSPTRTTYTGK